MDRQSTATPEQPSPARDRYEQVPPKRTLDRVVKETCANGTTCDHDKWQKAQIGVSLVGNDAKLLEARLSQIMQFVENQHLAEIIDSQVELCYLKS